ncbi:MAG: hypothetical protein AMXMBFR19_18080 [Chthonomonadaceae bacterium]|uniref:Uncharacterized protein n=1 Tax=Candidatus Nitrosymbiomonas proteolyticus TaxID=2608984 RepID=A0A809SF71_9BACT|nr:conserved hypothetical protein [Candidatus Nitrosymbiomonas proteolyticus]GIK33134.1 MAG: hypothetical protein BroJett009_21260 [Armatimonadota bacterium]
MRLIGLGTRVVCFALDEARVAKFVLTPQETVSQYRRLGIDLGRVAWSPCPGDVLESARILRRRSLASVQMAYLRHTDFFRLLEVHLEDPCDSEPPFVSDSLESAQTLPLAGRPWFLQSRALTVQNALIGANRERQQEILDLVLDCIAALGERGIQDKTYNFLDNFGLCDGSVFPLDVGELEFSDQSEAGLCVDRILASDSFRTLKSCAPWLGGYFAAGLASLEAKRVTPRGP